MDEAVSHGEAAAYRPIDPAFSMHIREVRFSSVCSERAPLARPQGHANRDKKFREDYHTFYFLIVREERCKTLRFICSHTLMILPQVHLRKPCYDFYFL